MQADIFWKRSGIERDSKPFWDQIDEREKAEVTKVGDQQDGIYGECPPCQFFSLVIVESQASFTTADFLPEPEFGGSLIACGLHAAMPNRAVRVVTPFPRAFVSP